MTGRYHIIAVWWTWRLQEKLCVVTGVPRSTSCHHQIDGQLHAPGFILSISNPGWAILIESELRSPPRAAIRGHLEESPGRKNRQGQRTSDMNEAERTNSEVCLGYGVECGE